MSKGDRKLSENSRSPLCHLVLRTTDVGAFRSTVLVRANQ